MSVPWVDKYRPRVLQEVQGQESNVASLTALLKRGSLPTLLFYGPPGTGKTSSIRALARELYRDQRSEDVDLSLYLKELNASHERGVDVIRNEVKAFVSSCAAQEGLVKLVILEEADQLTPLAQAALRALMEDCAPVARFCLLCNEKAKIIPALQSRCASYYFPPLSSLTTRKMLHDIALAEGFLIETDATDVLLASSNGDMRKAVGFLQTCAACTPLLTSAQGEGGADEMLASFLMPTISSDTAQQVTGRIPSSVLTGLLESVHKEQVSFSELHKTSLHLWSQGWPCGRILTGLANLVVQLPDVPEPWKAKVCVALAKAQRNIREGADSYLQLVTVLHHLQRPRPIRRNESTVMSTSCTVSR